MNEAKNFPGSENFTPIQADRLAKTLHQMREMRLLAVRSISERTGIGGWLPSGFGDTRGLAHIEAVVRSRCRAIIALETINLLGEKVDSAEIIDLVNDRLVSDQDVPSRVRDYLIQRAATKDSV